MMDFFNLSVKMTNSNRAELTDSVSSYKINTTLTDTKCTEHMLMHSKSSS